MSKKSKDIGESSCAPSSKRGRITKSLPSFEEWIAYTDADREQDEMWDIIELATIMLAANAVKIIDGSGNWKCPYCKVLPNKNWNQNQLLTHAHEVGYNETVANLSKECIGQHRGLEIHLKSLK